VPGLRVGGDDDIVVAEPEAVPDRRIENDGCAVRGSLPAKPARLQSWHTPSRHPPSTPRRAQPPTRRHRTAPDVTACAQARKPIGRSCMRQPDVCREGLAAIVRRSFERRGKRAADAGAFGVASGLDHSAAGSGELARVKASHGLRISRAREREFARPDARPDPLAAHLCYENKRTSHQKKPRVPARANAPCPGSRSLTWSARTGLRHWSLRFGKSQRRD